MIILFARASRTSYHSAFCNRPMSTALAAVPLAASTSNLSNSETPASSLLSYGSYTWFYYIISQTYAGVWIRRRRPHAKYACKYARMHTDTRANTCAKHAPTQTHMHARALARTHKHKHVHANNQTHTIPYARSIAPTQPTIV